MSSPPYARELALALQTVHRASLLTKQFLRSLSNNVAAETKTDDSPVTIADFAAQALIISAISAVFPSDGFIGEESATALREKPSLCSNVWNLVSSAPQVGDFEGEALRKPKGVQEMLDVIDLGAGEQTAKGRVWVLDPVDGTATFMKGQQYAVCLALLVDGVQKVGVIGCPNLRRSPAGGKIHEDLVDVEGYGIMLSAVEGQGAFVRGMDAKGLEGAERIELKEKNVDLSELDFVDAAPGWSSLSQETHRAVEESLGAKWPGTQLWSQQMKYISLALGATDVMLRIPPSRDRWTQVWDHAGGQLIFQEAGGIIKDLDGGAIDMGQGRKIHGQRNFGTIAALPWCFERVMEATKKALECSK
ncbi:carbohydrate phosphatase [Lepidopterella palustris CBS 459.81]|uniref:Carbohydrate phosphatase n=1 Tax=Lepidopterella palustris CBS 459.81 TaxID=1314670 RepID=A0A8E2JGF4_9PEZI|nr:carbohydrate phosphatase [Lepidopterella palustris CBS 459.81]